MSLPHSTPPVPSDTDAEWRLVAAALVEPSEVIDAVGHLVGADDFHSPLAQATWSAITDGWANGDEPDHALIAARVAQADERFSADAVKDRILEELPRAPVYTAAPALARRIASLSMRRRAIQGAAKITKRAFRDDGDDDALTDEVAAVFDSLDRKRAASEDTSFAAALDAALSPRKRGYSTGVAKIDQWTNGLVPGRYYVVSAASGFGKSWMLTRMGIAAAESGARVLLVSLEMDKRDMFARVAMAMVGAQAKRLSRNVEDWSQDDHAMALEVARRVDEMPGDLDIATDKRSPAEIGSAIRAGGFDVALIDYAQIVQVPGARKDVEVLRGLEHWLIPLVKSGDVAVVIGSQLNNEHLKAGQHDGTAGHLGGSHLNNGCSADIRLRPDPADETGERVIIELKKHRHGPNMHAGASDSFHFRRDTGEIELALPEAMAHWSDQ